MGGFREGKKVPIITSWRVPRNVSQSLTQTIVLFLSLSLSLSLSRKYLEKEFLEFFRFSFKRISVQMKLPFNVWNPGNCRELFSTIFSFESSEDIC